MFWSTKHSFVVVGVVLGLDGGRGCSWFQECHWVPIFYGLSKTVKCFSPQNHLSSPRTVEFVFDLRLLWRFTQVLPHYKTQTLSYRPTSVTVSAFLVNFWLNQKWRRSVFGFRSLLRFKAWSSHISLTWSLAVLCRVCSEGALSTAKPGFSGYYFVALCPGDVKCCGSGVEVEACRLPVSGNKPFGSLQRTFSFASLIMYWLCLSKELVRWKKCSQHKDSISPLVEFTYLRTQGNHLLLYWYHISW